LENAKRRFSQVVLTLLLLGIFPASAFGQASLVYATDFWHRTVSIIGYPANVTATWAAFDSLIDVMPAVNVGIRKVAVDIGVVAFDTITIVDGTFFYTLNSDFMDNGTSRLPYQVYRISSEGGSIQGLREVDAKDFSTTQTGTTVGSPTTQAIGYGVRGNRFWLYPAGDAGDKVYIHGPADGIDLDTFSDTTNIYSEDREAVCVFAAYVLCHSRADVRAVQFLTEYADWVERRTGKRPGLAAGGQ
jgi:hypothetical protein